MSWKWENARTRILIMKLCKVSFFKIHTQKRQANKQFFSVYIYFAIYYHPFYEKYFCNMVIWKWLQGCKFWKECWKFLVNPGGIFIVFWNWWCRIRKWGIELSQICLCVSDLNWIMKISSHTSKNTKLFYSWIINFRNSILLKKHFQFEKDILFPECFSRSGFLNEQIKDKL